MNLGYLIVRFFFLNSGNLICRSTGISMNFRESLGVRDNESRLYVFSIRLKSMNTHRKLFTYKKV